jgi:hypothetical protein
MQPHQRVVVGSQRGLEQTGAIRRLGARVGQRGAGGGRRRARELRHERGAALANGILQVGAVVDEERPRSPRSALLPLEQHR